MIAHLAEIPAAGLAALIALLAAAAGLRLSVAPHWARRLIPFSAGLLAGIALLGILPELLRQQGCRGGLAFLATGLALLWAVGRWVYAVCPACSHTHDHSLCAATLHGFALPLVVAASLHAFLDGIGISASGYGSGNTLASAVLMGVGVHKIPEGLALGIILQAALGSPRAALAWCVVVEAATPLGAALESVVSARLGLSVVSLALGLAGGSFLYLAYHAIDAEWRQRGAAGVLPPVLAGIAAAALLQQGADCWLH
ncbi:MAG: ZIP family metal transporter [Bryobacteraceae bacterium]